MKEDEGRGTYYKNLSTINHLRLPFLWTLVDNRHLQEWILIRCPLKSEMALNSQIKNSLWHANVYQY